LDNLKINSSKVIPVIAPTKDKDLSHYAFRIFAASGKNSFSANANSTLSKSPYDGYKNPNIIKTKKKFKSKISEILDNVKRNDLCELRSTL